MPGISKPALDCNVGWHCLAAEGQGLIKRHVSSSFFTHILDRRFHARTIRISRMPSAGDSSRAPAILKILSTHIPYGSRVSGAGSLTIAQARIAGLGFEAGGRKNAVGTGLFLNTSRSEKPLWVHLWGRCRDLLGRQQALGSASRRVTGNPRAAIHPCSSEIECHGFECKSIKHPRSFAISWGARIYLKSCPQESRSTEQSVGFQQFRRVVHPTAAEIFAYGHCTVK